MSRHARLEPVPEDLPVRPVIKPCVHCEELLKDDSDRKVHNSKRHPELHRPRTECAGCKLAQMVENALEIKRKTDRLEELGEPYYKCTQVECGKVYSNLSNLVGHHISRHCIGKLPYKCSCELKFPSYAQWQLHTSTVNTSTVNTSSVNSSSSTVNTSTVHNCQVDEKLEKRCLKSCKHVKITPAVQLAAPATEQRNSYADQRNSYADQRNSYADQRNSYSDKRYRPSNGFYRCSCMYECPHGISYMRAEDVVASGRTHVSERTSQLMTWEDMMIATAP